MYASKAEILTVLLGRIDRQHVKNVLPTAVYLNRLAFLNRYREIASKSVLVSNFILFFYFCQPIAWIFPAYLLFHFPSLLFLLIFIKNDSVFLLEVLWVNRLSSFFKLSRIFYDVLNRMKCQHHFLVVRPTLILSFRTNEIGHFNKLPTFLFIFIGHLAHVGFEVPGIKNIFGDSPLFGILFWIGGFGRSLNDLRGKGSVFFEGWRLIFDAHLRVGKINY